MPYLLDALVILGYFAIIIGIGVHFSRRNNNVSDFALGGRSIPWWAVLASILASEISAGTFFGTTAEGGASGLGTIFRATSGGVFTPLVEFSGANGATPLGTLVRNVDGSFYGTTSKGGASGLGEQQTGETRITGALGEVPDPAERTRNGHGIDIHAPTLGGFWQTQAGDQHRCAAAEWA